MICGMDQFKDVYIQVKAVLVKDLSMLDSPVFQTGIRSLLHLCDFFCLTNWPSLLLLLLQVQFHLQLFLPTTFFYYDLLKVYPLVNNH